MTYRWPFVPASALLLAAVLVPAAHAASDTAASSLSATAVAVGEARMTLDGHFDEPVWARAVPVTGFVQREPADGEPASLQTIVKVAFDAQALWVAVDARDSDPAKLVGLRTRRDTMSPSDWLRIVIDSYRDRRTAYEFGVNPAGVRLDRYWFNDGSDDIGWDAVWDVAVSSDASGWRAEFRIPFSQLRFRGDTPVFGFAVVRRIGRLNEESSWPHLPRAASGYVSSFGEITGIHLAGAVNRLELTPYGLTQATHDSRDEAAHVNSGSTVAGLDMKYRLTPGLTLTGTVNPDFGQVEADPAVVNLTAFETFFAERRPFFLEGSGNFKFDIDCNDGQCSGLFYSRRIGRNPHGDPEIGDAERIDRPAQTTILGATKVTGRARGFSFGVLNAVTGAESARIIAPLAARRTTVEPLTSYTVARARREFANQSTIGVMLTSTNRERVSELALADQAVTGGVDWDLRLSRRFAVQGFVAGSALKGTAEAIADIQQNNVHSFQRPDAAVVRFDPTRRTLSGDAGTISVSKIGGERVRFSSNLSFKSPGFDINDLGFERRADTRGISNWLQWRHDKPTRLTRRIRFNLNEWSQWNYDGDRLESGGNVNLHFSFINNWNTGFGINAEGRTFDDRLTRGGPGGYANPARSIWHYVESDDRRRVLGSMNWFRRVDDQGSTIFEVNPRVVLRPTSAVEVSIGGRFTRLDERRQWIENLTVPRNTYVFGRLGQTTAALTTRINYAVGPNLTVQSYMEPFASSGDYSAFHELVAGRAERFDDRFAALDYRGQPDFTVRSLRATNVLRWEYRPGSTLFVVWQQSRGDSEDAADSRISRDLSHVFATPGRNVLLMKFSYWFSF
ncbi:MAG: DUF5916 domain-containing protein [Vicinamibacterales bacterium]